MPLQIVRNDITTMRVDAIVNAAKRSLLGGGGVDGAIHRAAGPELLEECLTLGGCETGQAKLTKGYRLPARYIIHTVGPVYQDGQQGEEKLLRSCYRNSLALAAEEGFESVAFPLISAGNYGYPKDQALQIAVGEISWFVLNHDMLVYLVVYDRQSFQLSKQLLHDVTEFIEERYVQEEDASASASRLAQETQEEQPPCYSIRHGVFPKKEKPTAPPSAPAAQEEDPYSCILHIFKKNEEPPASAAQAAPAPDSVEDAPDLDAMLKQMDESFSQSLLRQIDEKGMTDAQCYKKANVDRKLFSKIRSNPQYKPSKPTAVAFAVALELNWAETNDFLRKAGYALSHSSKFDIIIEYFIQSGNYNIFEINETLFAFDQTLLGSH
ncbi:MAG: O-acetyl-ADP-ribose deacetylase [Clostridiales bacterium]|nr:O-acetyl-ADP-ribose deacetylase [Clostridiales bacterium]